MSTRSRAHPWFAQELPPYEGGLGGECVEVRGRYYGLPGCSKCHGPWEGHYALRADGYVSGLYCPGRTVSHV